MKGGITSISEVSLIFLAVAMLLASNVMKGQDADTKMSMKAVKLAQKYGIVDGHVDLPYRLRVKNFRLQKEYLGIPFQTSEGDFDYVRARKGGLVGPFMSIFIPSNYQTEGGAVELADSLINMIEYIAKNQSQYFQLAYRPKDVLDAKKNNKVSLPMGMENGAPVEDNLALIGYFKKRGISYITLTHAKDNKICDSSYDTTRTWKGLSPYGYKAIDEMVKVGIMIDISHVSDSTFYQVIRHVKVPVIASHSSCRRFTPGFERNMSDPMIRLMKQNKGIIMVNFGSTFLDSKVSAYNDSLRTELANFLEQSGIDPKSTEAVDYEKDFQQKHPKLYSDVKMVADHIDHIVSLAGIDHVGLGSDYDGVGDSLPVGLKDVGDYPNLIKELLQRGYSNSDIKKICIGNLFRVWNVVLKTAKS